MIRLSFSKVTPETNLQMRDWQIPFYVSLGTGRVYPECHGSR